MKFPKGTTEHPLNKSGKRKILVSVWDFGATHPQSERSFYLCNDHPAKMRPSLARAILQLYGESPVLDPMAGIGTTLVEAALNASKHVGGIASRDPQLAKTGLYSKSKDNIGNMVGQTYLSEMLKVYRECYRVLKPDKFMVVVVKDIQRKWKTVPLGADTIKLCQMAGFDCHDIIINKMYFPSFWMLSLAKKAQTKEVMKTQKFHALKSHEYVLVFRKP